MTNLTTLAALISTTLATSLSVGVFTKDDKINFLGQSVQIEHLEENIEVSRELEAARIEYMKLSVWGTSERREEFRKELKNKYGNGDKFILPLHLKYFLMDCVENT